MEGLAKRKGRSLICDLTTADLSRSVPCTTPAPSIRNHQSSTMVLRATRYGCFDIGSQTSGCSPPRLAIRSSEISRGPNFSQNPLILATGRRGDYSRHIPQALSHRSRLEEPASPAPRLADAWRAPVGSGVTGWLMRVIADDAHLSRPLLSATSCAIFVNN